jgi:hypothetical protein
LPPKFAVEFSLDYEVINHQYGFDVKGSWAVDHLNLGERTDNSDKSYHPNSNIKDYKKFEMINIDNIDANNC